MSITLRSICGVAMASLITACASQPSSRPYKLKLSSTCTKPDSTQKVVIFDSQTNLLTGSGWSHIPNPAKPVFATLSHGQHYPLYNTPKIAAQEDPNCPGQKLFQTVLVKKYGDWDNQHANGLEPKLDTNKPSTLVFGKAKKLVLELRLDGQATKIPLKADLKKGLGQWLSDEQLAKLDSQQIDFKITVFGPSASAPEEGYAFAGELFVTLNPVSQTDQWLRLEIPLDNMHFYKGLSYRQTPQQLADHLEMPIAGVQLNPETRGNDRAWYGKVARNFIKDGWGTPVVPTEMFKEYGISIRRMELALTSAK